MDNQFNLIGVVRTLLKWKWMIIGFVVLAGLTAVIYTWFFMENYYQSSVKFYPKNLIYTDKMVNLGKEGGDQFVDFFGSKDDANRILEIANSAEVIQGLINKYNLATHYGIDTTKKYWRTKVTEEFMDNYEAIRTEKDAIEISVMDPDPVRARDMLNDAITWIDLINKRPMDATRVKVKEELESAYAEQQVLTKSLLDTMASQASRYEIEIGVSKDGTPVVSGTNPAEVENYKFYQLQYESAVEELGQIKTLLDKQNLALGVTSGSLHIIEQAYVADKKAKPKRSLICVTVTLVAFILAILAAILIEQIRWIRQELEHAESAA